MPAEPPPAPPFFGGEADRAIYEHGIDMLSRQDLAGAIHTFMRIVAADSTNADAHASLGVALLQSGDSQAAADAARDAIALDPLHVDAHMCLGAALRKLGLTCAAIKCFRTVQTIQPGDPDAQACVDGDGSLAWASPLRSFRSSAWTRRWA